MKATFPNRPRSGANPAPTQTLKVQKVSPAEMAEHPNKGFCYYCDEKYSPGHKCREQKFFQIDASASYSYADIPSDETRDLEDSQPSVHSKYSVAVPVELEEPIISFCSLSGISTPQTLNIKGYIKHKLVVVLIDSGSTHNFIHRRLAEEIHCFVLPVSNYFEILISNSGMMKCGR
jgi:hypothetical protein